MPPRPPIPRRVHPHPLPLPPASYPHRHPLRLLALLHALGSLALVLLILAGVLVGTSDMIWQFVHSSRRSEVADIMTVVMTYVLFILTALFLVLYRLVVNLNTLSYIPHGYLPLTAEDAPRRTHELIRTEMDRAAVVTRLAQPKKRRKEEGPPAGQGRDGEMNYRHAILSTVAALRSALLPLHPSLSPSPHPLRPPLSPLHPLLLLPASSSPLPAALRPVAELYERHLLRAENGAA
ncbi:hypothetical protein JCM8097_003237 [Rhodosporidiobolus ruineniae]